MLAVVTGSNRGIGKEICRKLKEDFEGIKIIGLHEAVNQSEFTDFDFHFDFNIGDVESIKINCFKILSAVKKELGSGLDILINNAGIAEAKLFENISLFDVYEIFQVNMFFPFALTQMLLDSIKKSKQGRIINIASISGLEGFTGHTHYVAGKHAMIGFTKALAKEMAKHDITVNAVCPTMTQTDMFKSLNDQYKHINHWDDDETAMTNYLSKIPMSRLCTPQDVANVVSFLCKKESGFLTGLAIPVAGGQVMRG